MVASTAKFARTPTTRKSVNNMPSAKKSSKANTSILSFFKKSENNEGSLFLGAALAAGSTEARDDKDPRVAQGPGRFNEDDSPLKRRKINEETTKDGQGGPKWQDNTSSTSRSGTESDTRTDNTRDERKIKTPFLTDSDESDDEDDGKQVASDHQPPLPTWKGIGSEQDDPPLPPLNFTNKLATPAEASPAPSNPKAIPPELKQEDSTYDNFDQLGEFAELEGLDPDDFEGEEAREMRFMREQARLEAEEAGSLANEAWMDDEPPPKGTAEAQHCPICNGSLAGISMDEATKHVNSCLDGSPTPLLPQSAPVKEEDESHANNTMANVNVTATATGAGAGAGTSPPTVEMEEVGKRFARAAVPRPGQQNPLELAPAAPKGPRSAFSKLMSNNAEDSAWATAAASEKESRGRPAYERTCPFYKIMPGFSICVDAFRYGAVEGCKAYFLSHFHSDHYIGLTASWRHGPIYCSQVTGSLVRNQLRTAEKWVVELEFEKPYDIPGTGASVTMISANHCPGSSLFLFSKPEENAQHGRKKRILHCGDFRACPSHTGHALLKPDVLDAVSGKNKPQKIDICYLDTTYLNPRYSFPPQEDVIRACADLCANMSPDPLCRDDIWERSAKAIGTPAVSNYFATVKGGKAEEEEQPKKIRQRLLVICGTYSIGKERICVGIAKALNTRIFASAAKIKICKQLGDPELSALLTSNPLEAQVHMQMLMEIRAETLQEYLNSYKPHFSRILGFRPSGWNFRPSSGKAVPANTPPSSIPTQTLLHTKSWRTRFGYRDFIAQRGSTKEAMCFGVPYSEHSSFRELAMFVMSLRIDKIIPTVNVGSDQSRKRMKGWLDRWQAERRRGGMVRALIEGQDDENAEQKLWEGKDGTGGGAWW